MTAGTHGQARGTHRRARRGAPKAALVVAFALAVAAGYVGFVRGGSATGTRSPAGKVPAVARHATERPAARQCTLSADLVPACGAWWGMYLPAGSRGLAGAVRAEESSLGRRLGIVERYHDMSLSRDGVFPDLAERRLARHHLLLFSWAPNVWSTGASYQWGKVASGALDRSVIAPQARRLRAFHHKVFLTFAAEADGVRNQGTPAQFVAAWRHIHDVFARLGVRNVIWVWTTEGYLPHASTIAALYPGAAYVDWIGYDPYNFYACHHARWLSFRQVATPFYRWSAAHGLGGKPLMLAEFGSAADPRDPGREAAWYSSIVPALRQLPRIKALVEWNAAANGCDLRLPATSAAGRAYRVTGLSAYLTKEKP